MIDVVNAEMLRALRVVSVERGLDPRDFALVAFGGAGPLHACALAEELEIDDRARARQPPASSRRSASSPRDERRDAVRSYVVPLADAGELPADGEADLRYAGQSFELTVPLGAGSPSAFHRAHEERYGYADRERADRARRGAHGRGAARRRRSTLDRRRRSRPRARRCSSSTAPPRWIPAGWAGETDAHGTLVLRRST